MINIVEGFEVRDIQKINYPKNTLSIIYAKSIPFFIGIY